MKKIEFLEAVRSGIAELPYAEREAYISYYAEMIDDMIEDGMSEDDAVDVIGLPDGIAEQILREYYAEHNTEPDSGEREHTYTEPIIMAEKKTRKRMSVLTVILLILGAPVWLPLLLAGGIVLLAVYIVLWSLVISLYAIVLGFGLGGIALVLGGAVVAVAGQGMIALLFEGSGLVLIGMAILLVFVSNLVAKCAWFLTKLPFRGFCGKDNRT